jgi:hypothetical protein
MPPVNLPDAYMHKNSPSAYLGGAHLKDAVASDVRLESCIFASSTQGPPYSRQRVHFAYHELLLDRTPITDAYPDDFTRAELHKC